MRGFAYPRPTKVRAVQFEAPGELVSGDGRKYQYKTGDWCLRDMIDDKNKWVVDNDIFQDTYNKVSGDVYVKRARKTFFEVAEYEGSITTMEGPMNYTAGDYIITGVQGEKYPMSEARFNQRYYRVQLEKAAMLNNLTIDISKMMPDAGIPEHASLIGYSDFQALRLMSVEQAAGVTTSVGKLGMYLMYYAILAFLKDKKATPGAQLIKDLKESHSRLPVAELGKLGIKKFMLQASTDPQYLRNQLVDFREANRSIREDVRIPEAERKLFTLALRVARADVSESAVKALEKAAWIISPELGAKVLKYATGSAETKAAKSGSSLKLKTMHAAVAAQVKQLGGSGYTLSLDKAVAARENKKTIATYNEYLALSREIKKIFDLEFRKMIVANNNKPMDADEASKKMAALGFQISYVPDSKIGFIGKVGIHLGKLTLYTDSGSMLTSNISPGSKVTMNKNFDPEDEGAYYCAVKAPGAVGTQRVYTDKSRKAAVKQKFQKADNLEKILPRLLQAWKRDLQSQDPVTWMKATAAVILYWTGARVGSNATGMASRKGVEGFGILNLRIRHIKITNASVILDYAGKKGMHQRHTLPMNDANHKLVGKHLKQLIAGKGKEDLIFSVPAKTKGKTIPLTFGLFSKYLKANGFTMGAHKLRHVRGTSVVKRLLSETTWKPSKTATTLAKRQREAETWMKEKVLVKIANILGHQSKNKTTGKTTPAWQTSIKSYINPDVVRQWFISNKLDVPNWVPSKLED
jgi:integrase